MQRFINNPDEVVEDTVKGFVKAHSDIVRLADNPRVVVARGAPVAGKVGVVTGGGSGHEPAFIGYTGRNMLDDQRGGGAGNAAHAVMFGKPETLVAHGFRFLREAAGIGQRLGDGAAFDHRGQVEDGEGHHGSGLCKGI